MGKTAKAAKKRRLNAAAATIATSTGPTVNKSSAKPSLPSPPTTTLSDNSDIDDDELAAGTLVSTSDLATTIRTLRVLVKHEEVLKGKEYKLLKGASYDLHRVLGAGGSLTSRISAALSDARWTDALVLLSELSLRNLPTKLGALQRWVRECDAAFVSAGGSTVEGEEGEMVMKVLDAILRVAGGGEKPKDKTFEGDVKAKEGVVKKHREWVALADPVEGRVEIWMHNKEGTLLYRKPPNLYPAVIHSSEPEAFSLDANDEKRLSKVQRYDVPGVEGAFLLTDVLSPQECLQVVQAAEVVGFIPDKPTAGSAVDKISILAHNAILFAGQPLRDAVFERIRKHVPQEIMGGEVKGVNARWRVYRYEPGHLYRPHIDGAWPQSGLSATAPTSSSYIYDSSPATAPQWSRATLLLYLNDDFTKGHTTFYTPDPDQWGRLDATGVKPRQGSILVFPHGAVKGSLLHEGSGVGEGGKFVVRTDLLYNCERNFLKKREREEDVV